MLETRVALIDSPLSPWDYKGIRRTCINAMIPEGEETDTRLNFWGRIPLGLTCRGTIDIGLHVTRTSQQRRSRDIVVQNSNRVTRSTAPSRASSLEFASR